MASSTITKVSRSFPLKVTITPELHERLRVVAAQLGQAPATVASMAIGQYVSTMQASLGASDRAIDKVMQTMGPGLMEQMKLIEAMPRAAGQGTRSRGGVPAAKRKAKP